MTTFTKPIFCGDMAGKLTQFNSANGTIFVDITTADPNGPVRLDVLAVSLDDPISQAVLALKATDGTNIFPMANIPLNRAIKNVVTNSTIQFSVAANYIARSAGSWLADGFKVGDYPIIINAPDPATNLTGLVPITALSDANLVVGTSTLTPRGPYFGTTAVGLADTLATTNLLTATNMAPFVGTDAAGNKFLELPKGWKLQAALVAMPSSGRLVSVQARWGVYASAA